MLALLQPLAPDTLSLRVCQEVSLTRPAWPSCLPQPCRAQPPRPFPIGSALPGFGACLNQARWGTSSSMLLVGAVPRSDVCPQIQDPPRGGGANTLPLITPLGFCLRCLPQSSSFTDCAVGTSLLSGSSLPPSQGAESVPFGFPMPLGSHAGGADRPEPQLYCLLPFKGLCCQLPTNLPPLLHGYQPHPEPSPSLPAPMPTRPVHLLYSVWPPPSLCLPQLDREQGTPASSTFLSLLVRFAYGPLAFCPSPGRVPALPAALTDEALL